MPNLSRQYGKNIEAYFFKLRPFEQLFENFNSSAIELNSEMNMEFSSKVINKDYYSSAASISILRFIIAFFRDFIKVSLFKVIRQCDNRGILCERNVVVTYVDKRNGKLDQKDFNNIYDELSEGYQIVGLRLPSISWKEYFFEKTNIYKIEKDFSYIALCKYYFAAIKVMAAIKVNPTLNNLAGQVILRDIHSGHGHFGYQMGFALKKFVSSHAQIKTVIFPFECQDWILFSSFLLSRSSKVRLEYWQNGLRAFGSLSLYKLQSSFAYRGMEPSAIRVFDSKWERVFQQLGYRCKTIKLRHSRFTNENIKVNFDEDSPLVLVVAGIDGLEFETIMKYASAEFGQQNLQVRFHPSFNRRIKSKYRHIEFKDPNLNFKNIVYGNTAMRFNILFPSDRFIKYHTYGDVLIDPWSTLYPHCQNHIKYRER